MKIGVLALQGAFIEHRKMLSLLNTESFEIRQKKYIEIPFDGLILPGGESTVIGKLLRELGLFEPLREKILGGFPVFGTCAGLLLLAKTIENDSRSHFAAMDITAKRNAYGRQLGSFYAEAPFGETKTIPMTFIRAPYISKAEKTVTVLSEVEGKIVAARQNRMLVTSFHPELNENQTVHQYFLNMIKQ